MDSEDAARIRRQLGIFDRAEARRIGLSDSRLSRAVEAVELRRLDRGIYAAATTPDSRQMQHRVALARAGEAAAFRGRSAAWLWGLDGFEPPPEPELVVPQTCLRRVSGKRVRRGSPAVMARVVVRHGVRVTGLEDTVRELAAQLPADDLEALVVDMVNRQRRTTVRRLLAVCGRGLPGSAALRQALAAADEKVLSIWERRLVQILRRAGIRVEVNYEVVSPNGKKRYLDLCIPALRLAIEVDGYAVHSRRDRFRGDRVRKRELVLALGWRVVEVTVEDIRDRPDELVAEIKTFIAATPVVL